MTSNDIQQCLDLDVPISLDDVLRNMGYPTPKARLEILQVAEKCLAEAQLLLRARAVYRLCSIEQMSKTQLTLTNCPTLNAPIAKFIQSATRVAVFVITVGEQIDRAAHEYMSAGEMLTGYAFTAIGSAAADRTVDILAKWIGTHEAHPDEAVSPPFSPGYCGMPLVEQQTLFQILDTTPIGVHLLPSMFMTPTKSVSGLLGIGPKDKITAYGIPCQWCDRTDCPMRRTEVIG